MSAAESHPSGAGPHGNVTGASDDPAQIEGVAGLPVLARGPLVSGVRELPGMPSSTVAHPLVPAVQAAAAAAGGFLAGAAILGLVDRHRRRAASAPGGRRARRRGGILRPAARRTELVQIAGSRSLLVDVHLLAER